LERRDGGPGDLLRRHRVVELLLAQGALLDQRPVAGHVALGLGEVGLPLPEVGLGLLQLGLQLSGIDLEQRLALPHEAAFRVDPPQQVTGDLRADLGVDVAGGGADPFAVDGHVLLDHLGDDHHGRRRRWRRRLLAASRGGSSGSGGADNAQAENQLALHPSSP
jgi:hypothetical protein